MDGAGSNRVLPILGRRQGRAELAEAVLALAQEIDPSVDVSRQMAVLHRLSAILHMRIPPTDPVGDRVYALNEYLFMEAGFSARDALRDPRDEFLDRVLERRRGGAVALAILYITLGERLDLTLEPVAVEGRVLARLQAAGGEVFLDPARGGITLFRQELAAGAALCGVPRPVPLDRSGMLARFLREVKAGFLARGELEHALWAVNRLLLLEPEQAPGLRERARLYEGMREYAAAMADYHHYLELSPSATDAEAVRGRLDHLRHATRLH